MMPRRLLPALSIAFFACTHASRGGPTQPEAKQQLPRAYDGVISPPPCDTTDTLPPIRLGPRAGSFPHATPSASSAAIVGIVRDLSTHAGLSPALIRIAYDSPTPGPPGTASGTWTDTTGAFAYPALPAGTYRFWVNFISYRREVFERTLVAGAVDTITVDLTYSRCR